MKKLSILILASSFSVVAFAGFSGPGSTTNVATVKSIEKMNDDEKIILEGYMIKQVKSEHYLFKDKSGEIEIEVDDEDFRGVKVTPEIKIRIIGEVDKDWSSTTIDVDHMELVE